jgi:hypothetical protein
MNAIHLALQLTAAGTLQAGRSPYCVFADVARRFRPEVWDGTRYPQQEVVEDEIARQSDVLDGEVGHAIVMPPDPDKSPQYLKQLNEIVALRSAAFVQRILFADTEAKLEVANIWEKRASDMVYGVWVRGEKQRSGGILTGSSADAERRGGAEPDAPASPAFSAEVEPATNPWRDERLY